MTTPNAATDNDETPTQFDSEIVEINAQLAEISASDGTLEERFEALLGAVQNYVVPMFESLRSEMHTGLSYVESQIDAPDPADIIKAGQEAVGTLMLLTVELLKDRGWYDAATGMPNDKIPEKMGALTKLALDSAKKFQDTVATYEAIDDDDGDADEYEDEDEGGDADEKDGE